MKNRFWMFKRGATYYVEDTVTGKQESLRTSDRREAERLHQARNEPYLSTNPKHQGLILHSVYHRPNGWDYIPQGRKVPCGESSMWGDYHAREVALYVQRVAQRKPYLKFFL